MHASSLPVFHATTHGVYDLLRLRLNALSTTWEWIHTAPCPPYICKRAIARPRACQRSTCPLYLESIPIWPAAFRSVLFWHYGTTRFPSQLQRFKIGRSRRPHWPSDTLVRPLASPRRSRVLRTYVRFAREETADSLEMLCNLETMHVITAGYNSICFSLIGLSEDKAGCVATVGGYTSTFAWLMKTHP